MVEAVECPTLLMNGYGEHNIQGIGDKHVPLIHNVMNTDLVIGVSDQATDGLNAVFNTDVGRDYLARRLGVAPTLVARARSLRPLLDRQHPGRHQDGQARSTSAPTTSSSPSRPTATRCTRSELARYLQRRHNQRRA